MNDPAATETFHCFACGCTHPGAIFREGDEMWGRVVCPQLGERTFPLSSDAELFESLRKGRTAQVAKCRYHFVLLHVTDRCSMRCPICYAESGGGEHLPYEEVVKQAKQVLATGVRNLALTGGEPTEHPDILRIVRTLGHDLKSSLSLLTNGKRLGEDPEFAVQLKAAGLRKVHISIDTLVPETSVRMRGGDYVEVKKRAFANAAAAGLAIAANVTVGEWNLDEVGALFKYLAASVPRLSHVLYQPQNALGRGKVGLRIDRERVMKELARSPEFPLDDVRDFTTVPLAPAFGVDVHPDCNAMTAVLVKGDGERTTLRSLDAGGRGWKTAKKLAAIKGRPGLVSSCRALAVLLGYVGPTGLSLLGRWWRGGRGTHVVLALVDNLPNIDFMLEDRIRRCGSAVVCGNGELAPVCAGYITGRKGAL